MTDTSVDDQSLCLSYDEAVKELPKFMLGDDSREKEELAMFLKQVALDAQNNDVNASSIFHYIAQFFEDYAEFFTIEEDHPTLAEDFSDDLSNITGEIATEIAYDAINDIDSHTSTLKVLRMLQQFSWETKVALSILTYTLSFGDYGLNISAKSKVTITKSSSFLYTLHRILEGMVEFELLPQEHMTSNNQLIKVQRTHFVVAVYWIIRAIVATSTWHIMTMSNVGDKVIKTTSRVWERELHDITEHLFETLHKWKPLLEVDDDSEDYKKTKEVFCEKGHTDNMKILNTLFFPIRDDYEDLVLADNRVHVKELEGKNLLLLISQLDINPYECDTIKDIYLESKKKFEFEMVWFPVVDAYTAKKKSMYEKLRSYVPWHCLYHPPYIEKSIKRFFRDDWKFEGEPIIAMLDHQGNVVNQNALQTMLIWHYKSIPFTSARHETLWEQEYWRLELLFNGIDQQVMDWIHDKKYIFIYGGDDIEWIRRFTRMVHEVALELEVPIEMVYVGSNTFEMQQNVSNTIKDEKLSHYLSSRASWHFNKRRDTLIKWMIQHEKSNNMLFQEIQKLDDHIKSYFEWTIFAKGSRILVNGHDEIVMSFLKFKVFGKGKSSGANLGVGEEFEMNHQKL